jgi:micrococcal nuclease
MSTRRQTFGGKGNLRPARILRQRRGSSGIVALMAMLFVAAAIGSGATMVLQKTSLSDFLLDTPQPGALVAYASRSFPVCAGRVRVTCIVDGDTFWLDGVKIRLSDINTPEIGQPECAAEAALGRRATNRLAALLGAGPFTLARDGRDEDQYGRKLRVVERDGHSLGAQMVAEGLAHDWWGRRESWC